MACELLKMATDDNVADSVKLAAIRDALDRAGLAAKTAVAVEVGTPKPYEVILEQIQAGSRDEYRKSIGRFEDSDGSRRALADSPRVLDAIHGASADAEVSGDLDELAADNALPARRVRARRGVPPSRSSRR